MLFLALLATCSPLLASHTTPVAAGLVRPIDKEADRIKSLLKAIEKNRDRSNSSVFLKLGEFKTKGALKAL